MCFYKYNKGMSLKPLESNGYEAFEPIGVPKRLLPPIPFYSFQTRAHGGNGLGKRTDHGL